MVWLVALMVWLIWLVLVSLMWKKSPRFKPSLWCLKMSSNPPLPLFFVSLPCSSFYRQRLGRRWWRGWRGPWGQSATPSSLRPSRGRWKRLSLQLKRPGEGGGRDSGYVALSDVFEDDLLLRLDWTDPPWIRGWNIRGAKATLQLAKLQITDGCMPHIVARTLKVAILVSN